jgi:hypothetical protein
VACLRGTEVGGGLLSLEAGLGGATRGLGGIVEVAAGFGGMVEVAAGFVGLAIALRGVGMVGVRVVLLDLAEGAVADLVCRGGLTLLGLVDVVVDDGGGIALGRGAGAGVGRFEGFLFPTGSLDKRGMPRGMPVGLAVVCE